MKTKIILLLLLILTPVIILAETIKYTTIPLNAEDKKEVIFSTEEVNDPEKIFIRLNKPIDDKTFEKIQKSYLQPQDVFYPDFSRFTNLVCEVKSSGDRVIYYFDLLPGQGDVYLRDATLAPLFDATPAKVIDFNTQASRIEANSVLALDYSNVAQKSLEKEIDFVGIKLPSNSSIRYDVYEYVLYPLGKGFDLEFLINETKHKVYINSNVISRDGYLEIYDEKGRHALKILPSEIYQEVMEVIKKAPNVEFLGVDLEIYENRATYTVRVVESFSLFGFISMKINSKYYISAGEDNVINVEERRPIFALLGTGEFFPVKDVVERIITLAKEAANVPAPAMPTMPEL